MEPWALAAAARDLGVPGRDILGAELFLVDASRAVILGSDGELINSGRIDNLAGCHAILAAFHSAPAGAHGQVAVFFDNEEIGSGTRQGADGLFLRDVLARICARSGCDSEGFYRALAASFCVSVDAAQGWHPSYPEKYDDAFSPVLNGGPAVKANANFKYATDADSGGAVPLVLRGCRRALPEVRGPGGPDPGLDHRAPVRRAHRDPDRGRGGPPAGHALHPGDRGLLRPRFHDRGPAPLLREGSRGLKAAGDMSTTSIREVEPCAID
ncbi:MAG: hypothetical protein M0C28_48690 [Candidatus Moduliflexus flocculans]|nr:hypothetical protein [Candidatus Moduliflexus flocculans]